MIIFSLIFSFSVVNTTILVTGRITNITKKLICYDMLKLVLVLWGSKISRHWASGTKRWRIKEDSGIVEAFHEYWKKNHSNMVVTNVRKDVCSLCHFLLLDKSSNLPILSYSIQSQMKINRTKKCNKIINNQEPNANIILIKTLVKGF